MTQRFFCVFVLSKFNERCNDKKEFWWSPVQASSRLQCKLILFCLLWDWGRNKNLSGYNLWSSLWHFQMTLYLIQMLWQNEHRKVHGKNVAGVPKTPRERKEKSLEKSKLERTNARVVLFWKHVRKNSFDFFSEKWKFAPFAMHGNWWLELFAKHDW